MKMLTVNRLAGAGIRANRKSYLSLGAGIFASVFLVCAVVLGCFSAYAGYLDRADREAGRQDAIAFHYNGSADGLVKDAGFCTVLGTCEDYAIGFFDAQAERLAYRQMFSGRMPQKAGEMAAELNVINWLAPNAEPGDTIRLTITPLDGEPEEREYVLTGIVLPQKELSVYDMRLFLDEDSYAPRIFVSAQEPAFATGRQVRNLYLTFKAGQDLESTAAALGTNAILGFDDFGWYYGPGDPAPAENPLREFLSESSAFMVIVILGMSLLLFALFGIGAALESQLERKQQEIAMLRAVGATRRQIRAIFGRESILLACILAPAALAMALVFDLVLCQLAPTHFVFYAPIPALVIMGILSLAAVLLASFLPLWRSSRMAPMGIIRDTAALRKARHFKSQKSFRPALLVALRKLRLRPMGFVSGSVLTALLCVATLAASLLSHDALRLMNVGDFGAEFYIYRMGTTIFGDLRTAISSVRLTDQDLEQIRSLPHVAQVKTEWRSSALLQTEGSAEYLETCYDYGAFMHPVRTDGAEYEAAKPILHQTGSLIGMDIVITDHPEELAVGLAEGEISRAALDSGETVLLCAPDYYLFRNGDGCYSFSLNKSPHETEDVYIHNDSMKVGQRLTLTQFAADPDLAENNWDEQSVGSLTELYRKAAFHQCSVQIGGILRGLEWFEAVKSFGYTDPVIVTTPRGLESLGLERSEVDKVSIYLDSAVDEDTERFLENRISRIANRGDGLEVQNNMQLVRENRATSRNVLLICGSMLAIFLWVSVSIIAGGCSRQMQAEKKTIGTLRVLGMNGRTLAMSYMGQAALSITIGLLVGLLASVIMMRIFLYTEPAAYLILLWEPAISALALALCGLKIGSTAKRLLQNSVIDNIREV